MEIDKWVRGVKPSRGRKKKKKNERKKQYEWMPEVEREK